MSNPQGNETAGGSLASLMGAMSSVKEKWDSSGASEAMSSVSSQLPQGAKDFISEKGLFNRAHLRTVTVYFGIGEERPFYVEKAPSLLAERIRHNVAFFYLNYAIFTALLFVLTLLVSPGAIIGIGLLALAWMYVVRASSSGSINVYGVSISQKNATMAMAVVSVVVLWWLLSHIFWWTIASSGFLCGLHALLRDASMHKDEEDKVVMSGDLTLGEEEASFLNEEPAV